MPRIRKLTKKQDQERKLELTKIRRLRAKGLDGMAERAMRTYRRKYWVPHSDREKDGRYKRKRRNGDNDGK